MHWISQYFTPSYIFFLYKPSAHDTQINLCGKMHKKRTILKNSVDIISWEVVNMNMLCLSVSFWAVKTLFDILDKDGRRYSEPISRLQVWQSGFSQFFVLLLVCYRFLSLDCLNPFQLFMSDLMILLLWSSMYFCVLF